jgi:hypothetical protein
MAGPFRRELGLILAWLAFPLVPVVLEDLYYQGFNQSHAQQTTAGPDPHDWEWRTWVIMLGPLLGYGFLAGATVNLPDDLAPSRRGWRRLLARRSVWVAVGPWLGYFLWVALIAGFWFWINYFPPTPGQDPLEPWRETWIYWILSWAVEGLFMASLAYAWLWPAWAALRRAARIKQWGRALYRGVITATAFVGSLFGSFWAITSSMRSYFFDPTVMPLLALALGLVILSGCTSTITYGEMRRRELFHALLVSWVLGLALMWRWWSRRRPGPPRSDTAPPGGSH